MSYLDFCSGLDLEAMAARSRMSKHEPRWTRVWSAIEFVSAYAPGFQEGQHALAMQYNT